jgi:hypothetical protein
MSSESRISACPAPSGSDCRDAVETMPGVFDLPFKEAKDKLMEEFLTAYISKMLTKHGGNVSHAAKGFRSQASVSASPDARDQGGLEGFQEVTPPLSGREASCFFRSCRFSKADSTLTITSSTAWGLSR